MCRTNSVKPKNSFGVRFIIFKHIQLLARIFCPEAVMYDVIELIVKQTQKYPR